LEVVAMDIKVGKFLDVADGVQPGQFTVTSHDHIGSLTDLDPTYRQLLDKPVTMVLGVEGPDGRPNLTPMWFDYDGDRVLINCAEHRKKTGWLRRNPEATVLLMNPDNAYHWVALWIRAEREISEDDPKEGRWVVEQLDKIWHKYTGDSGSYALRDPSMDEKRVLFVCSVQRITTFGRP
jgi:PPOX class probable F420-dependent enzyme